MNEDGIKVKAKIKLYRTENGGRKTAISTGYRPNHVFEYADNSIDFVRTYIGEINLEYEYIQPGESAVGIVWFSPQKSLNKFIQKGRIWGLNEGSRKIGEAEILEILSGN